MAVSEIIRSAVLKNPDKTVSSLRISMGFPNTREITRIPVLIDHLRYSRIRAYSKITKEKIIAARTAYIAGVKDRVDAKGIALSVPVSNLGRFCVIAQGAMAYPLKEGLEHLPPWAQFTVAGSAIILGGVITYFPERNVLKRKKYSASENTTGLYYTTGKERFSIISSKALSVGSSLFTNISNLGSLALAGPDGLAASLTAGAVVGAVYWRAVHEAVNQDKEQKFVLFAEKVTQKLACLGDKSHTERTRNEIEVFRASQNLRVK
ncbi:hypothetical protein M1307_03465 [Patescibacteria group bacterium]|nr:hypothetical protein [Patescibacteria group bacterium]